LKLNCFLAKALVSRHAKYHHHIHAFSCKTLQKSTVFIKAMADAAVKRAKYIAFSACQSFQGRIFAMVLK